MRYEEPSSMVRWDSPLFVVPSDIDADPSASGAAPPEPAPLEEIWEACTTAKSAKAPLVVAPVSRFVLPSLSLSKLTHCSAATRNYNQLSLPSRVLDPTPAKRVSSQPVLLPTPTSRRCAAPLRPTPRTHGLAPLHAQPARRQAAAHTGGAAAHSAQLHQGALDGRGADYRRRSHGSARVEGWRGE